MRKHGKRTQLWVSADTTDPDVGDSVGHVTGMNFSGRANVANGTAAGDEWAVKLGGIPDASINVTGRVRFEEGTDPLFMAFTDQEPRRCFLVYDSEVPAERLEFTALVAGITRTAQHTGFFDWSAALEITGAVADPRTGP